MKKIEKELCVASLEAVTLASKYNFERIELCQALEFGGLTPSFAFQQKALATFPNTHILIRPRVGDFTYSDLEKKLIIDEIETSLEIGAKGIVFGALNSKNALDVSFLKEVKDRFPAIDFTFHRAFDELQNPLEALEKLIDLGFKRILTSGGKVSVLDGLILLEELIFKANKQIEIMIGGGIKEENIDSILKKIRPNAIHFSGTVLNKAQGNLLFSSDRLLVSEAKINSILETISRFSD